MAHLKVNGHEIVSSEKNSSKFLHKSESITEEMKKMIADLDASYLKINLGEERGASDMEERLSVMHEKVLSLDSDQSMIWDRDPEEATTFLKVVAEVQQLAENLESVSSNFRSVEHDGFLCLAHNTLQIAMSRLEEEFIHILIQYQQPVDPEVMSFRSTEDDSMDEFSSSSFDEVPIEGRRQSDSGNHSEEFVIDLIHPSAVYDLRCIAEAMIQSNYEKECCQTYISIRKDALDECLFALRVERFSIEETLQMDWTFLNSQIKRWNRAIKIFVRVYLASERRLCEQIFGDFSKSLSDVCFAETSKGSVLQLLNFGEAITIGPPEPEKLFRVLDMYEGLADLVPDIESLFPEEFGSFILEECKELLSRLAQSVRMIFVEFKKAIKANTSTTPFAGGGIHPLTKYVMNYLKVLADYGETFDSLLREQDVKDQRSLSGKGNNDSCKSLSAVHHFHSVTSVLEANLECRSMLYKDAALQNIYMMNNICYMVQKVKDSDLRPFLGDDWIRVHNGKFQQHARNYERASWTSVLSFLKDEGICNAGSNTPSKTVLKERFKCFNLAFEEVYRAQTAWFIPSVQLREDLRISISLKVLQAYRTFMGKYCNHLDSIRNRDHYIKYSPDDLESYLLDLFEGLPKSLHYPRRR